MDQSLEDSAKEVIRKLKKIISSNQQLDITSPILAKCLEWVRLQPGKIDPTLRSELIGHITLAFHITEKDVLDAVEGEVIEAPKRLRRSALDEEAELEASLPKEGWFATYINYTRFMESPLSYHLVCSLALLGSALGRRCWMDQGHYTLFSCLNGLLVGPTGVVRKTSAVDVAKHFIRTACICPIMADKITAESMVGSLVENTQQFLYAPEFSVFFGKQRYNEGLTTLILRLLDYPAEWSASTIIRSDEVIIAPTLTILGGSTMSLLRSSSADEVMSGGFLNRFLTIVEETTPRIFPRPRKGPGETNILKLLEWLKTFSGEVKLVEGSEADKFYIQWYIKRNRILSMDSALAEVLQRGSDHLLRIAMLIHVADCANLIICERCIRLAATVLGYIEKRAPLLVKAINASTQNTLVDYVTDVLIRLGGASEHSNLLRRCNSKLNATQFRAVIDTLNESGRLQVGKKGLAKYYILKEEVDYVET